MPPKVVRDTRLTNPEIALLAQRAGLGKGIVKRMSALMHEEVHGCVEQFITDIIHKASKFTNGAILPKHIMLVLPVSLYSEDSTPLVKGAKGTKGAKGAKAEPVETRALLTSDKYFRAKVISLTGKVDENVIHLVHLAGEQYIVSLLYDTISITKNSGRGTVMPKDIQVALSIRNEFASTMKEVKIQKVDFRVGIRAVLNKVNAGINITDDALGQLNFFVNVLAANISQRVAAIITMEQRPNIEIKDISMAVSGLLVGYLNDHAQKQINGAPGLFKAELAEKFLRNCVDYTNMLGCSTVNLKSGSSQALVSVLEYFCAELLDLSSKIARKAGTNVNARALSLALADDEELSLLFRDLGMVVVGGGGKKKQQQQQQQQQQ